MKKTTIISVQGEIAEMLGGINSTLTAFLATLKEMDIYMEVV